MNYYTKDLDLAATLIAFKYPILAVINDGKLVELEFPFSTEMQETIKKYWNGTLLVQPQLLFEGKKRLRALINDSLTNN